eukprot:12936220-Prorocentrum_lima.AAC.1
MTAPAAQSGAVPAMPLPMNQTFSSSHCRTIEYELGIWALHANSILCTTCFHSENRRGIDMAV